MGNWDRALKDERLIDPLIGAGLFAASFLIYLGTLAPSVATIFDDSLEFQLVSYLPGIAHPTGYPLYTLLGKLFTFLPVGDVAYRVNLMSAFFAALTVVLLYAILRLIVKYRVPAALGAASFALSPVFWSQAVIAEVYTLNAAFVALTLCLLLAWARSREEGPIELFGLSLDSTSLLYLLTFEYGLSLTHHRTMLLLAPAAILFLLLVDRRLFTSKRMIARLTVLMLAPLVFYLYIPLRGTNMSSLDGVYENTWRGFLTYISAGPYSIFLTENPLQQSRDLAFYLVLLRDQFTWLGIALGLVGLGWSFRRPKAGLLLALSFASVALFAILYQVPDVEVFLIPVFLVWAIWIGVGFTAVWESFTALTDRFSHPRIPAARGILYLALLVAGALLPLYLWRSNRGEIDRSQHWEVHDYGKDMLSQPLEEDAVVIGILGEMTLLNYFQATQGLRPDLTTIPADGEDERLAVVKEQMDAGRPVYLTRPLPGVEDEYHLSSVGPLIRVRERPVSITDGPSHPLALPFGESVLLTGYDAELRDTNSGPRLRVTLYWQAIGAIDEDYKVSVRLLDEGGHLGAVQDAYPVGDAYRTNAWRSGEKIVDTRDLPILAGLPPGEYGIHVTMYDPETLAPLASAPVGNVSLGPTPGLANAGPWDVEEDVRANFARRLSLLGYSVVGEEFAPGDVIPMTFLWQALTAMDEEYHLDLWLEDGSGQKWGEAELPLGGRYAPAAWKPGQMVRDWQGLLIPGNVNDGSYQVKMRVLAGDEALPRLFYSLPATSVLGLGEIEVRGRARSFAVPEIQQPLRLRLGETIMLLGYDLQPMELRPGEQLRVTLYWQCLGLMDTSYTVFVHLLDGEGSIRGQQDNLPGQGTLPTTSWVRGEVIVDAYKIAVAHDAPPGPYAPAVGMYDADTGDRLQVFDEGNRPLGDYVLLSGIEFRAE
jgi:hypothetical protein